MDDDSVIGTAQKFVGVYSGRLYDTAKQDEGKREEAVSEIGTVWQVAVLDELLGAPPEPSFLSFLMYYGEPKTTPELFPKSTPELS